MSYNASRWLSRRRRVLVGTSAAGIAAALVWVPLAVSSSAASTTANPAISATAARQLDTLAEQVARTSGDARPQWIQAVATTRDKGLRLATPGDMIPGSARQNVYVVVMKGNFTLHDVPTPPHSPAPTGHYLAITVDRATLAAMDMGLSNQAPPVSLRSLGPVSTLAGASARSDVTQPPARRAPAP